jgi:hypothetical protein
LSRSHSPRLDVDGTVEVFCGVDVARETHHAVAVDRSGRSLADRALPNDEAALRKLFTELAEHGRLLVVVDQPASIGALAIAVARSMGVQVGSPICIRARVRPTLGTRSSSPTPLGRCRMRCVGLGRTSRR